MSNSNNRSPVHFDYVIPLTTGYSDLSAQKYSSDRYIRRSGHSSGMSFYIIRHTIPSVICQLWCGRRDRGFNDKGNGSYYDRTVLQKAKRISGNICRGLQWSGNRFYASIPHILHPVYNNTIE